MAHASHFYEAPTELPSSPFRFPADRSLVGAADVPPINLALQHLFLVIKDIKVSVNGRVSITYRVIT